MAQLAWIWQQFTNLDGTALSGGSVEVFVAGTAIKATTYQDPALTIEHSNPIILGNDGFPPSSEIYIGVTSPLDFVVKDAGGAVIKTLEDIEALAVGPAGPAGSTQWEKTMLGGAGYLTPKAAEAVVGSSVDYSHVASDIHIGAALGVVGDSISASGNQMVMFNLASGVVNSTTLADDGVTTTVTSGPTDKTVVGYDKVDIGADVDDVQTRHVIADGNIVSTVTEYDALGAQVQRGAVIVDKDWAQLLHTDGTGSRGFFIDAQGAKPIGLLSAVDPGTILSLDAHGAMQSGVSGFSFDMNEQAVITDYAFDGNERKDSWWGVDATAAARTVNIDPNIFTIGVEQTFSKIDSSANTVTINAMAGQLIDGAQTYVMTKQWQSVTLVCDGGANWIIKSVYDPTSVGDARYIGIDGSSTTTARIPLLYGITVGSATTPASVRMMNTVSRTSSNDVGTAMCLLGSVNILSESGSACYSARVPWLMRLTSNTQSMVSGQLVVSIRRGGGTAGVPSTYDITLEGFDNELYSADASDLPTFYYELVDGDADTHYDTVNVWCRFVASTLGSRYLVYGVEDEVYQGSAQTVTSAWYSTSTTTRRAYNAATDVLLPWTSQIGPTGRNTLPSLKVEDLAGTGTRMVVADANGLQSTQAIPSGGGEQVVERTAGNLTVGATTTIVYYTGTGGHTITFPTAANTSLRNIAVDHAGSGVLTIDNATDTFQGAGSYALASGDCPHFYEADTNVWRLC